jgi:hypothetical protein
MGIVTDINDLASQLIEPLDTSDLLAHVRRALAVYTFQLAALFPSETNWGGKAFGKYPADAIRVGRRLAAARLIEPVIAELGRRATKFDSSNVNLLFRPTARALLKDEIWTGGGLRDLCNTGLAEFQTHVRTRSRYSQNIDRIICVLYPGSSIAKVEPRKKYWVKLAKDLVCSVGEVKNKNSAKKFITELRGLENHVNQFEATSALIILFSKRKGFKIPDLTSNEFSSNLLSMTSPGRWNRILARHDRLANHLAEVKLHVRKFALPTTFVEMNLQEPKWVTNFFFPNDNDDLST